MYHPANIHASPMGHRTESSASLRQNYQEYVIMQQKGGIMLEEYLNRRELNEAKAIKGKNSLQHCKQLISDLQQTMSLSIDVGAAAVQSTLNPGVTSTLAGHLNAAEMNHMDIKHLKLAHTSNWCQLQAVKNGEMDKVPVDSGLLHAKQQHQRIMKAFDSSSSSSSSSSVGGKKATGLRNLSCALDDDGANGTHRTDDGDDNSGGGGGTVRWSATPLFYDVARTPTADVAALASAAFAPTAGSGDGGVSSPRTGSQGFRQGLSDGDGELRRIEESLAWVSFLVHRERMQRANGGESKDGKGDESDPATQSASAAAGGTVGGIIVDEEDEEEEDAVRRSVEEAEKEARINASQKAVAEALGEVDPVLLLESLQLQYLQYAQRKKMMQQHAAEERRHISTLSSVIQRHTVANIEAGIARKAEQEAGEYDRNVRWKAIVRVQSVWRQLMARRKVETIRANNRIMNALQILMAELGRTDVKGLAMAQADIGVMDKLSRAGGAASILGGLVAGVGASGAPLGSALRSSRTGGLGVTPSTVSPSKHGLTSARSYSTRMMGSATPANRSLLYNNSNTASASSSFRITPRTGAPGSAASTGAAGAAGRVPTISLPTPVPYGGSSGRNSPAFTGATRGQRSPTGSRLGSPSGSRVGSPVGAAASPSWADQSYQTPGARDSSMLSVGTSGGGGRGDGIRDAHSYYESRRRQQQEKDDAEQERKRDSYSGSGSGSGSGSEDERRASKSDGDRGRGNGAGGRRGSGGKTDFDTPDGKSPNYSHSHSHSHHGGGSSKKSNTPGSNTRGAGRGRGRTPGDAMQINTDDSHSGSSDDGARTPVPVPVAVAASVPVPKPIVTSAATQDAVAAAGIAAPTATTMAAAAASASATATPTAAGASSGASGSPSSELGGSRAPSITLSPVATNFPSHFGRTNITSPENALVNLEPAVIMGPGAAAEVAPVAIPPAEHAMAEATALAAAASASASASAAGSAAPSAPTSARTPRSGGRPQRVA